jgi:hypothetical protein
MRKEQPSVADFVRFAGADNRDVADKFTELGTRLGDSFARKYRLKEAMSNVCCIGK